MISRPRYPPQSFSTEQSLSLTFGSKRAAVDALAKIQRHQDRIRNSFSASSVSEPKGSLYEDFDFGSVVLRRVWISSIEFTHGPDYFQSMVPSFTMRIVFVSEVPMNEMEEAPTVSPEDHEEGDDERLLRLMRELH